MYTFSSLDLSGFAQVASPRVEAHTGHVPAVHETLSPRRQVQADQKHGGEVWSPRRSGRDAPTAA